MSILAQAPQGTYGYKLEQEFLGRGIAGPLVPTRSAIYKTLNALEADGFIQPSDPAELPPSAGRDRRPFVVTEVGQRQLTWWMDEEPESIEDLWFRIACARREDVPALIRRVKKAERECLDRLEELGPPAALEQLAGSDAHWRLVTRVVMNTIELSQVAERSRLLREIRAVLTQVADEPRSP